MEERCLKPGALDSSRDHGMTLGNGPGWGRQDERIGRACAPSHHSSTGFSMSGPFPLRMNSPSASVIMGGVPHRVAVLAEVKLPMTGRFPRVIQLRTVLLVSKVAFRCPSGTLDSRSLTP